MHHFFKNVGGVGHTQKKQELLISFLSQFAGGNGPFMSPLPTKLLINWEDITTEDPDVPAFEKTTW